MDAQDCSIIRHRSAPKPIWILQRSFWQMEKKALGKGLAALLPESEVKETGQTIHMIPVTQIQPNPVSAQKNVCRRRARELVESIKRHGILQPVLVRRKSEDRYELIAGERRFRAATLAQLPAVPAVIRKSSDEESTILSLIENIQRSNLNPVEEAKAYRRLIDEFGVTQEAVAERVGRDRASVANICRMLSLSTEVQGMVASGQLTLGHAKVILGKKKCGRPIDSGKTNCSRSAFRQTGRAIG